ncbi:hypothetical protein L1085_016225 [Streptomyces sp. MSC1_001]|jgi:hypothetical protein|uniref:hypothetical protein n=1 Tax=Streptomyces sp. MSC1_001 TaxID=2909263 RepID=UPI00202E995D|nr:hypothetical protein [Streptomyces sp. MSC1_001]
MNHTTAAAQLQQVARLWPDLTDALGTPTTGPGFGLGLRGYLATLDQHDAEQAEYDRWQAAALRALERSPDQLGTRPIPISLRVHDTMRTVEAALLETCDQIAAASQRAPMPPAPASWPTKDRIRRNRLAAADARDPQRWHLTGVRPGVIWTALWLSARADGARWPGRPLDEGQQHHVARVAAEALRRIEATLDLAEQRRELTSAHPCQCGGTIEVYGGAGAQPVARCKRCGAIWHEGGVVAA